MVQRMPVPAQAAGLEVHDVDEGDEVGALVVERVVAAPPGLHIGRLFAVAVEVGVGDEDVMFAGDVEGAVGLNGLEELIDGVEFLGLGEVGEVAGVEEERWRGAGIDQADGFLVAFGAKRFLNFNVYGVTVLIHFKRNFHFAGILPGLYFIRRVQVVGNISVIVFPAISRFRFF